MGNDEYEILPHKEILNIKKELNDLKGGSSTKQLADSMEELKKTMGGLIDLFKAATQEMKTQEKEEVTISKKIDKVIKQNKIIAEGIVSVADMLEEMRGGGSSITHASPELSSLGVEPPKPEPEAFHPEPTPEPFHPEPKPEPFHAETKQEPPPFHPPQASPHPDPSMKQDAPFPPPQQAQAPQQPPSASPSPTPEQKFEPPEFSAPDFGHPGSVPNEPPPLDFGAPPGPPPSRSPFPPPPSGRQQFPPPPGGEFPQPPEPPKDEEPKKKSLFGSLFKK